MFFTCQAACCQLAARADRLWSLTDGWIAGLLLLLLLLLLLRDDGNRR